MFAILVFKYSPCKAKWRIPKWIVKTCLLKKEKKCLLKVRRSIKNIKQITSATTLITLLVNQITLYSRSKDWN